MQFDEPVSFGEALYRGLTGKSPNSEGKTFGSWARDAVKNLGGRGRGGGVRRLAKEVGVSPSTVRKWMKSQSRSGKGISEKNAEKLKQAQRASRITEGRKNKFLNSAGKAGAGGGGGAGSLVVTGIVVVSNDVRERTIYLGHHLPANAVEKLIDALINGGMSAVGTMLNQMVSTHYVSGMRFEAITAIEW